MGQLAEWMRPKGAADGDGDLPPTSVHIYPERRDRERHWLDPVETLVRRAGETAAGPFRGLRLARLMRATERLEARLAGLRDAELGAETRRIRQALRRHGVTDYLIPTAFAVIREQSRRVLGLRHHGVQILGGCAILDGTIAEMDTGEGKTVTAVLAAATAAMAGIPVHVVTVNDYLAGRDAETMGPVMACLGLSVGVIVHGLDPDARSRAYASNVVYASNKEIAFDYLRDRVRLGGPPRNARLKMDRFLGAEGGRGMVMRGLHFAIVDEADSVLVDEARTPLILSRETDAAAERVWAEQAHALVDPLREGPDYRIIRDDRRIELTEAGKTRLRDAAEGLAEEWQNPIRREHAARQALTARLLFDRGDQYVVLDGKVTIVDEYTGRIMDERSWSAGLHQLVEVKERVEVTSRKEAMARMTYQRFFRRYRRLGGMTGTAREVAPELAAVYGLRVVRVPPNVPSRMARLAPEVLPTAEAKRARVAARTAEIHGAGRPVLIGTRSVAASEEISAALAREGLDHRVLNAMDVRREAEIIATAGEAGAITVATNMAGRGVDIVLGPGVAERGGLHVILTERHDARRIDRQLEGRTARRGDPGSTEAVLSLEDSLLTLLGAGWVTWLARLGMGERAARALFRLAQRRAERAHFRARRILLEHDRRLTTILAFSGNPE